MDLSDPTRAVTPTLDGPVLAVLAAAGRPLTVSEVAAEAARGSEIGIRRSLSRLVDQGLVRATLMGRNTVHELNRDHVAAAVADVLAGLRLELWARLRAELTGWGVPALFAAVFGSAARGDGDADSDIDLLLVHPPLMGEIDPGLWEDQLDELRQRVHAWTGNHLQVVDVSTDDWVRPDDSQERLFSSVRAEGVELARSSKLPLDLNIGARGD